MFVARVITGDKPDHGVHVHGIGLLLAEIEPVELEIVKRGKAPTLKLFKSLLVHWGPVRVNPPIVITAPVQSGEMQGPPLIATTFGMEEYGPLLIGVRAAAITAPEAETVRLTCAGIWLGALIVTEGAEA